MLAICRTGYEKHLAAELAAAGLPPAARGAGHVQTRSAAADLDLCFAHACLRQPEPLPEANAPALADSLFAYFGRTCAGETFAEPWPLLFRAADTEKGLSRYAARVSDLFTEMLRRRMSRVGRLARTEPPRGPWHGRGLFVYLAAWEQAHAARDFTLGGQHRMADDPQAPSRSYLKIEEAYAVHGREPVRGEVVVDLGAAPGGWSYSAAKRGCRVLAVDNGPLKAGALNHPGIVHVREDAFRFRPATPVDWLFCDLVEEPHHVLGLVRQWLSAGWCRHFIVNLKFGRARPVELLHGMRSGPADLAGCCAMLRARHLYHDREEFTVVGTGR